MKISNPSKLKTLLLILIFSSAMVLGQAKRADAYGGAGEGAIVLLVIAAVATYVTVMGVACTPIAAVKAADYPGGFSGAFGDCFSFKLDSDKTAPAGANNDTPEIPAAEEDNGRHRDDV